MAVDVALTAREELPRKPLIRELTAALEEGELQVEAVREGGSWVDIAGLPRRSAERPEREPLVFHFLFESAIGFVLSSAVGGVVGSRTDDAVMALVNRLRGRDGASAGPLDRDSALRRAQAAIGNTWPGEVNRWRPTLLEVESEELAEDGSWLFSLVYKSPTGVDRTTGDWIYEEHLGAMRRRCSRKKPSALSPHQFDAAAPSSRRHWPDETN